jgi:hypothetical protein
VGTHLGHTAEVVKVVATNKSWWDESVYECLGEVKQVMRLCLSCKPSR